MERSRRAAVWVVVIVALAVAGMDAAVPVRASGSDYVVCLDPGHTFDRDIGAATQAVFGAETFSLREVDLNLDVAHALRQALLGRGVGVVMTWDGAAAGWPESGAPDEPPPPFLSDDPIPNDPLGIEARGRLCVAGGAHVMFSVHHNGIPGPGDGLITLYRDPGLGQYDRDRAVAKVVHRVMWDALGRSKPAHPFTDYGLYFEDWGIARGAIGIPAVILEPVIITDRDEARWLTPTIAQGGVRRRQIVEAELAAILAARSAVFDMAASVPPSPDPVRAIGGHAPVAVEQAAVPSAPIRLSAGAGVAPFRVEFTTSVDDALVYAWSFGDGEFTHSRVASHVYQRPGLFIVRFAACDRRSGAGCILSTATVNVQAAKPLGGANVTPGEVVNGSIDRPGELNRWKFQARARDRVTVSMRAAQASPVDPVLRLIGPDGRLIAFSDDFEKRPDARMESVQLPLSGEYVIEASGFGDSEGAYALDLTVLSGDRPLAAFSVLPATAAAPADVRFLNQSENAMAFRWDFGDGTTSTEWAPAHRFQSAGRYQVTLTACLGEDCSTKSVTVAVEEPDGRSVDTSAPVRGLIDFEDDIDTRVFTGSKGAEVTIELVAAGGGFEPTLFLKGPDGVELAKGVSSDETEGRGTSITAFILPAQGKYTIDVLANPGSGTGAYQLKVAMNSSPAIRPAVRVSSQDPIASAEVVFTDISLGGPTSSLWDFGDGIRGTGGEVRHRFPRPGTFVVRLQSCNPWSCAEWAVRLHVREDMDGGQIVLNGTVFGAIDSPGDEDTWILRGAAAQVVTITVIADRPDLALKLDVLRPDGVSLVSGDGAVRPVISGLRLPVMGDYAVRVRAVDGNAQGRYRIQVSTSEVAPG